MGLSVRVYGNVRITENEDERDFLAYVIDDSWKHKIKNLKENASYIGDLLFRGVSYGYGTHNRFRESLIILIERTDLLGLDGTILWSILPSDIPFNAFIDFADNEGCLDWEISEKIFFDFDKFKEKAKFIFSEYEYSIYETWLNTFEKAKNNGVVVFS